MPNLSPLSIEYLSNKIICIIGFMGSGKDFFGNHLAKELNAATINTDLLIEDIANKQIYEIFKEHGEHYFRTKEKEVLQNIVYNSETIIKPTVIIFGGGTPLKRYNQKLLKQLSPFYIFLNPPFDVIYDRIKGTKRPLTYRRSRIHIFSLWAERNPIYQKLSNISITDTDIFHMFAKLDQYINLI